MTRLCVFPVALLGANRLRTTRPQHSRACNIRETEASEELRPVSRTPARAAQVEIKSLTTVNQVHSFTCTCPTEDVDGVSQYSSCYTPFNFNDSHYYSRDVKYYL